MTGIVIQLILFLFVLHIIIALLPMARRIIPFEQHLNGKKLSNVSSGKSLRTSKTLCAHSCLLEPNCLSFNFCGWSLCELNPGDIFSGGAFLESDPKCFYMGMKKMESPVCQLKGGMIMIILIIVFRQKVLFIISKKVAPSGKFQDIKTNKYWQLI